MKKKTANKPSLPAVIINALEDLKAQDIVIIDVSRLSDVTDTMIIASGSSNRQVRAIAQHAAEETKKKGMAALGIEGLDAGEWVLADFGDVVLHVMQPEIRAFYDLEKLWLVPGYSETVSTVGKAIAKTGEKKNPATASKPPTLASVAKKPAAKKPGAAKPPTQKTAAKKSGTTDAESFINQSDAAKARRKPAAPKNVKTGNKPATKTEPAKAGVYAKTGTRKPAAKKTAIAKPAATGKTAGKKTTGSRKASSAKPAARKNTGSKPRNG